MTKPLRQTLTPATRSWRGAAAGALAASIAVGVVIASPSAALAQEELDLYAENAWVIDQIGAEAAWETTKGAGVTVAVIDLGIAAEHPFLEDKDILPGKSFLSDEPDALQDGDGHGTGVAAGVLYAAPEATILPVRVSPTSADVGTSVGAGQADYDGIHWAADNGADVMVIPWGEIPPEEAQPNEEFLEAIQYAIDMDVVVIAAAGNDPDGYIGNPGSYPGVVTVSGEGKDGEAWPYSTIGPETVLAAPADTMVFPNPQIRDFGEEELYFEAAGTSAASGVVGGVAALVRAGHPDLDASNVIQRLISTADDGGAGRTDALGFGAVDADKAVHADVEPVSENPLGYPLGAAGASGASPDEASSDVEPTGEATSGAASENPDGAAGGSDPGLLPVVIIAAAVVLLGTGVVVWLVLRSRSRPQTRAEPWQ